MRPVRILFVTPEFGDFVKVGGLGDVSAALPRAIGRLCDIRVLVPGYRRILSRPEPIEVVGRCDALAGLPACSIGRLRTTDGITVYVLLCNELYDSDGTPYADAFGRDWSDNDVRFGRFAAAAADLAQGLVDQDWKPDLVHVNDWPSALVPAYLHWRSARVPTILTIHNLAYQGLFPRDTLARIGAPPSAFHVNGVEFYDKVSFLKAGLVYASHLTTVSENYAGEITTPQFGCGLDGLLRCARRIISSPASSTASTRAGTRAHAPILPARINAAIGKASAQTRLMCATHSGSRSRADLCSVWSPAWCIRKASTWCWMRPNPSFQPAARSW
jgi:starch synthase